MMEAAEKHFAALAEAEDASRNSGCGENGA